MILFIWAKYLRNDCFLHYILHDLLSRDMNRESFAQLQKNNNIVIPAQAGIQSYRELIDSRTCAL